MGKIISGRWLSSDATDPVMEWCVEHAVGIHIVEDREGGESMTWDAFIKFVERFQDEQLNAAVQQMKPVLMDCSIQGAIKIVSFEVTVTFWVRGHQEFQASKPVF